MRLRDLLRDVAPCDDDTEITAVTADSRLVTPGALFVAVPGLQTDGAKFIDGAIQKGAIAIAAPFAVGRSPLAEVVVDDPRAAVALIAANFYGRPAGKLEIAGVTGTSGKTTTTKMIESIFDAGGEPVGLVGTIEYRAGDERLVADRTTPDAVVLQQWFAKMVDAGVRRAVMEVSSHALALKRTLGIRFAAAVFTNLSQDHFDFHKDFDDYFRAKRILFDQIDGPDRAVINADDEYGRRLAREIGGGMTFGMEGDIRPAKDFEISTRGLRGVLHTPIGDIRVESPMLGQPNLYNWMAAVGAAIVLGIGKEQIEAGIRNLAAVRGRFEYVPAPGGPTVIVDYAHKPDAMEKLLHAVRKLAGQKKVVVVFGCGGDRDKDKRPMMGGIAARLADRVVLTSDNPRSEKPDAILDDIERGMRGARNYARITDRREAIARTIDEASDHDVIVIAGKGHETYQVIGDRIVHFDDREEAELALKKKHEKTSLKI
ncbi:MAG: UDP-N-acetylmuramoyl-L-alanyl-D-glutamate--2,6-diaminopimelate ligase [Acidobacteriota bacterium]